VHFCGGGESLLHVLCGHDSITCRSLHNVRIERLWRDVRKDSLEAFRQVFMHLEGLGLLDMEDPVHRTCLFLVFRNRIQQSLNRTRDAWNHHKLRMERNKTPIAIYELSRQSAITHGYWTGDPGDDIETASDPMYGVDGEAPLPPAGLHDEDPEQLQDEVNDEVELGVLVNSDEELAEAQEMLNDMDFDKDDGNWGIEVYCQAVLLLISRIEAQE
jgi:hypothetical protein